MENLLKELDGTSCRCGLWKHSGHTLCRECFRSLPFRMRDNLYLLVGNGYTEAYKKASEHLKRTGRWSHLVE